VPVLEWSEGGYLGTRLGSPPAVVDMIATLCGPASEDLSLDHLARAKVLHDTEETLRDFYKIVEESLTLEEEEGWARQAEEA